MKSNAVKFLLLILTLTTVACQKDDLKPEDIVDLQDDIQSSFEVRPTTSGVMDFDLSLLESGDTSRLVFLQQEAVNYDVGDVLILDQCPAFPYGVVLRITGKEVSNDRYIYDTRIAGLSEAFSAFDVKVEQSVTTAGRSRALIPRTKLSSNLTLSGSAVAFPIELDIGYTYDNFLQFQYSESDNQFTNVEIGLQNLILSLGVVKKFELYDLKLEAKGNLPGAIKKFASVPLPTITIPTGPGTPPIFLIGSLDFETFASIKGTGSFELGFDVETPPIDAFIRLDPLAGEWTFEHTSTADLLPSFTPLFKSSAKASVESGVKFKIAYKPYGISGILDIVPAQLSIFGKAGIEPNFNTSPFQVEIAPAKGFKTTSTVDIGLFGLETLIPSGSSLRLGFEWPAPFTMVEDLPRYTIALPCDMQFDSVYVDCQCDESNNDILVSFSVDARGGSTSGYRIFMNDVEIQSVQPQYFSAVPGVYTIRSDFEQAVNTFRIQDRDDIACSIEKTFTNPCSRLRACTDQFTDARDGQQYCIVEMPDGNWWMAEDLKFEGGGVCYDNEANNCQIYGRLYTYNEVLGSETPNYNLQTPRNVQGICPDGWHIPSVDEWQALINSVAASSPTGSSNIYAAEQLKAYGWQGWTDVGPSGVAEPTNGFDALPSGQYYSWKPPGQQFGGEGQDVYYWSSSVADVRSNVNEGFDGVLSMLIYRLPDGTPVVTARAQTSPVVGNSCRCVKD